MLYTWTKTSVKLSPGDCMTMIAFCGIDCSQCDTYRATIADDNSLRRETANRWSVDFGFDISSEDVSCSGCHGNSLFKLCSGCPFKLCCEEKGISNCGECEEYPCETLERFLKALPNARRRLDSIHEKCYHTSE
ncbi:DUF3795 domain-containing protein [Mesotoga prima]